MHPLKSKIKNTLLCVNSVKTIHCIALWFHIILRTEKISTGAQSTQKLIREFFSCFCFSIFFLNFFCPHYYFPQFLYLISMKFVRAFISNWLHSRSNCDILCMFCQNISTNNWIIFYDRCSWFFWPTNGNVYGFLGEHNVDCILLL